MPPKPPFAPPPRFDAPPQSSADARPQNTLSDNLSNNNAQAPFPQAHNRPYPRAPQSQAVMPHSPVPQPQSRPQRAVLPAARFFRSEKTYGHEAGFSCCFRQWRAEHSHCRLLHGYALSFRLSFIAQSLDKHGWVMDFGGLKPIKSWLEQNFDHKILLAEDDPARPFFHNMAQAGLCTVKILPFIGCEAFAYYVWQNCDALIRQISQNRVRVESAEVREHGGNAAVFKADNIFAAR